MEFALGFGLAAMVLGMWLVIAHKEQRKTEIESNHYYAQWAACERKRKRNGKE